MKENRGFLEEEKHDRPNDSYLLRPILPRSGAWAHCWAEAGMKFWGSEMGALIYDEQRRQVIRTHRTPSIPPPPPLGEERVHSSSPVGLFLGVPP